MVSFYLSDLRSRRESKCVRFSIYLSKFADKKKGARDKTNPFQMRGGALDRAAGAARDGGAFGTATAPVARFAAFRGAGRAAAFGGGGGGGVCFLLRAVVVASAAAAFGAGLVPSSSSSVASSSSSPPPSPSPSSAFFWTPGQNAVVLPPTLIQLIPCPPCVFFLWAPFSSQRWWKIHSLGNSAGSAPAAQAVSATERRETERRSIWLGESWPERASGWIRAAKRTLKRGFYVFFSFSF